MEDIAKKVKGALPKVSFSTKSNLISKNIEKGITAILLAAIGIIMTDPGMFFENPEGQFAVILIGLLAILKNFLQHTITVKAH